MKHNKKYKIIFPTFESVSDQEDKEIIQIFMYRFRDDLTSRNDIKVLKSIQKTADLTGYSDAVITKTLVDYGLRVARRSLPQQFLDHIDGLALRHKLRPSYERLKEFWICEGDNPFAFVGSITKQKAVPSYLMV